MTQEKFQLAPMSRDFLALTGVLLLLPVYLAGVALKVPTAPNLGLLGSVGFIIAIYLGVWLVGRPLRFEVSDAGLMIVWPSHRRRVPVTEIAGVSVMSRREFRGDYGYGIRLGAGGLWGGFGLLFTRKGPLSMFISRTDGYVLVRLTSGRPVLLTPTDPDRFAAALSLARGCTRG